MAQDPQQPSTELQTRAEKPHWSKLEEVENEGRPPFLLTIPELKLLGIAGVRIYLLNSSDMSDLIAALRLDFSLTVRSHTNIALMFLLTAPSLSL
jgi:hypothetical protein